jgi:hypothetical protein
MSSKKSLAALAFLAGAACVASFAVITSEREPSPSPATARVELRDEHNQLLATKSRERIELRDDLQRSLDEIDAKISITTDRCELESLNVRRATLEAHMDAIDLAADHEWDALKARIERSLGNPST